MLGTGFLILLQTCFSNDLALFESTGERVMLRSSASRCLVLAFKCKTLIQLLKHFFVLNSSVLALWVIENRVEILKIN